MKTTRLLSLAALALMLFSLSGCAARAPATATPLTLSEFWLADPAAAPVLPMAAMQSESKGPLRRIVFWIPNRIFDLLDIVRLRVRLGLGLSAGVRATKPLSVAVGVHSTFFIGLFGPRGEPRIPWPFGFDNRAGAEVSVVDVDAGEVYYGLGEIGGDAHLFLIGLAVGVDVWEVLDFLVGIVTIDLQDDDF
jgi:hypothetical protein